MSVPVRKPPFVVDRVPVHGSRIPKYIALHTTEGLGTVESLARFFRNTPAGLGSSFLVERSGRTGIYVPNLSDRTYAVANHNTDTISIEQIGFAATKRTSWLTLYRRQVYATAWLCAWLCDELDIPPVAAGREGPRGFTKPKGITQHRWIPDTDHDDCGTGYPFDLVLKLTQKWVRTGGPTRSTRILIATGKRP